ncbi:MAG: amidohydrolase family protein [Bryobacteraceae bacterium]
MTSLSRREWLGGLLATSALQAAPGSSPLVDTHIHLFAADQERFPYHANAVYKPEPRPLEDYVKFVRQAGIDHTIIVHPEPYQDDHRYLEYCFENEPSRGFFKGTCLFDPIAPETPGRMAELVKKLPGRIVALRVHATAEPKDYPTKSGPIRDRDLSSPEMKSTWRKASDLGLAIQMHMIPYYAPQVAVLAKEFRDMPVIIDHLARSGFGTADQYEAVLKMAELPRVYMKFSGVRYSSKQEHPYPDAKPLVKRTFEAFGADRMIWGGLGTSMAEFAEANELFKSMFDYATEDDREKIRGRTAVKLYRLGST